MTEKGIFNYIIIYWSLYIVGLFVYFYFDRIDEYRNSEKVQGEVVDVVTGTGYRGGWYDYPQYQFTYHDSIYYCSDNSVRASIQDKGNKATIIFSAGKPDEAIVYKWIRYWFQLRVFLVSFMIAFFVFFLPYLFHQYSSFKKEYPRR